jgi:hypothetical protein
MRFSLSLTVVEARVRSGKMRQAVKRKLATHFQSMKREKE